MKNTVLKLTMVLLLLTLPMIHFAQAPNLGRVASFALFTSAGAFGNTGASAIIGDIGTHVGAITGFPPGTLSGSIHIADSVTTLASTNLASAFSSLSTLTCDSTIGATLGNGQILTPKVYCITTLANLNGNLTFNAMGNPNAVFVIKVNGALSTGLSSRILLTNSANLNNVYWFVNGAFTLGDSSIFRGTLIGNGAINLMLKSSILGRGLTTAGAISIQNTSNVLPVNLISFTAHCNKENIEFKWTTASEKNNRYFTLESSLNQANWVTLANIKGAGTSNLANKYAYNYANGIPENKYYRLKQTDMDGSFTFSDIVLTCSNEDENLAVDLYPNPTSGILSITALNGVSQTGAVTVFNMLGVLVYKSEGFPSSINLTSQPNGIYFINLNTLDQNIVERILVQHD